LKNINPEKLENDLSEDEKLRLIDELKERIKSLSSITKPNYEELNNLLSLKLNLGYLYSSFDKFLIEALKEFTDAEELMKKLNLDQVEFASLKGSIASIYFILEDYVNSEKFYLQSLDLLDDLHPNEKIIGKKGLGLSRIQLNKTNEGIINLLEAAELCVNQNDIDNYLEIITILKIHFKRNNQWDMILELEKKVLKVLENLNNKIEMAYSYLEIGVALSKLKNYQDALNNFKLAVNIGISENDNELIYKGILMIAETFLQLKEVEKAKDEYLKAISMASFLDLQDEVHKNKIILKLLEIPSDKIDEAIIQGKIEREKIKKNRRIKT